MPKNSKKRPFRLIQRFLQTENFKKNARGYPLINYKNFRKKSHSAEKNPKGGPFGLTCTFGSIKKIYGLVRESNPRTPAGSKMEDEQI